MIDAKEKLRRKRISDSLTGVSKTAVHCKNISLGRRGIIFTEEHSKNISKALTGRVQSDEEKINHSTAAVRMYKDPAAREKRRQGVLHSSKHKQAMRKFFSNSDNIKKISITTREAMSDPKVRERCRIASVNKWKREEYRNSQLAKMYSKMHMSPNNKELLLMKIIELNNLPFKFVGNGKIIIDGFNPDFLNADDNLIIELFGDYWHSDDVEEISTKCRRIKSYRRYGYKCLIMWERELADPDRSLYKIINFLERSLSCYGGSNAATSL